MKAYENFLKALRRSQVNFQPEVQQVELIVERSDYFLLLSWDTADHVYLVNHFYKDSLDFDMTHTWTESFNEAFKRYSDLVLQVN